ncbi:MAG: hypothetical protein ACE5QF_10005 [Thermoplasmata archaeon]
MTSLEDAKKVKAMARNRARAAGMRSRAARLRLKVSKLEARAATLRAKIKRLENMAAHLERGSVP